MLKYKFSLSKYKLRNYEFDLALNELKGQFPKIQNENVSKTSIEFKVENLLDVEKIKKLTYFSIVECQDENGTKSYIIPEQVLIEKINCSDLQPSLFNDLASTKREIRYLTHSFHEYKGRYYPQLAKSLINYAGVKTGDVLFDPFCGSGTGLVESFLYGLNAFGTDINPVAYLIAKSKIRSFFIEEIQLSQCLNKYQDYLKLYEKVNLNFHKSSLDIDYLLNWFPEENLHKFLYLLSKIESENSKDIELLLKVTLSSILKEYSYQDPTQLRIRRRKDTPKSDLLESFILNLDKNIKTLKNYKKIGAKTYDTKVENYLCDIKKLEETINVKKNSVDIVVTSPPYVTALPYIDTDRISLFAFGLAKSPMEFRKLEKTLIGNREITPKERQEIEELMINSFSSNVLPYEVIKLIEKIYFLNKNADVGFRRKNMAALTFKYFMDMKLAMKQVYEVLKYDKYAFFVVGNNKTTAGNEQINIPTDDFIGLIGQSVGFDFEKKINLDVQKSYMIYSKNAINTESILVFKKR